MRRRLVLALALLVCVAAPSCAAAPPTGKVVELTDNNFDAEVAKGPTFVVVSADWCTCVPTKRVESLFFRRFSGAPSPPAPSDPDSTLPADPQALQGARPHVAVAGEGAGRRGGGRARERPEAQGAAEEVAGHGVPHHLVPPRRRDARPALSRISFGLRMEYHSADCASNRLCARAFYFARAVSHFIVRHTL